MTRLFWLLHLQPFQLVWMDRDRRGYAGYSNPKLFIRVNSRGRSRGSFGDVPPPSPSNLEKYFFKNYWVSSFSVGKIAHLPITTNNGDLTPPTPWQNASKVARSWSAQPQASKKKGKKRVRERKISLEGRKSPPFFNLIVTRMHNTSRKSFNGGGFGKTNWTLQANIESGALLMCLTLHIMNWRARAEQTLER